MVPNIVSDFNTQFQLEQVSDFLTVTHMIMLTIITYFR